MAPLLIFDLVLTNTAIRTANKHIVNKLGVFCHDNAKLDILINFYCVNYLFGYLGISIRHINFLMAHIICLQ